MKKLLIGLFIFGSLVMGTQVHASVSSILKDVSLLKSKLGAVLYYSGTDGYTRNTYDYVGSGGVLPSPVTPTSVATTTSTTDLTPRISYWPGKVNQHVSVSEGMWQTDPDGSSGSGIDKLAYCQKWYPNTTSVADYKNETINTWHDAGNVNDYPSTRLSFKCVEPTVVTSIPTLKVSLDSSSPIDQTMNAGNGNVVFVRIKIAAGSQDVNNLNAIQIASNLLNATKLNSLAIYDGPIKIGSTNNGLTYNGSYYQSWVYLNNKLSIPANTSKILSIVADTSPFGSSSFFSGDVRLGVAGWTFDSPGAMVVPFGTAIYGGTFTISSSSNDITPSITLISPNGGEVSEIGKYMGIKYEVKNAPAGSWVGLALYKDNNAVGYITLGAGTSLPGDGNLYWRVGDYVDYVGSAGHIASVGSGYTVEAMLYTGEKPVGIVPQWPNQKAITFDRSNATFTIGSTPIVEPVGTPSVSILTPNGGENYYAGQQVTLRWKTNNIAYNPSTLVAIMDDRTPGWQTKSLFGSSPALNYSKLVSSSGSEYVYEYIFTVPSTFNDSLPSVYKDIYGGSHYKMLVNVLIGGAAGTSSQKVVEDYSDNSFTINSSTMVDIGCSNGVVYSSTTGQKCSSPFITVLSPNGGEKIFKGNTIRIKWNSLNISKIYLKLYKGGSIYYDPSVSPESTINLSPVVASTGYFDWSVPYSLPDGSDYSIKLANADSGTLADFSDAPFSIVSPDTDIGCSGGAVYSSTTGQKCSNTEAYWMTLISPEAGKTLNAGEIYNVRWDSNIPSYAFLTVKIRDINLRLIREITIKNDGQETVKIPSGIPSGVYKLEISNGSVEHTIVYANAVFRVASEISTGCSNGVRYDVYTGLPCPVGIPAINTPTVKVYSPKGSDTLRQGLLNTVSWTGGKNKVQAGLVSENYTGQNGNLFGWMELNGKPNSMISWDGSTLKALDGSVISYAIPGKYKVVVVSESELGNYCFGSNSSDTGPKADCNYDLSNTFTIKPASTVDIGCSNGAFYSSTTGQACVMDSNNLAPIKRTLKQGINGDDVKTLQKFLGVTTDGVYGRGTASKVREWQLQNGLYPDGSFGTMSRQKAGLVQN